MSASASISKVQASLAVTSLQDSSKFNDIRKFLSDYTDLEILRHWTTSPLLGAPSILDHAIGVAPDLEWNTQPPSNLIPELEGKITQVGYVVFPMAALRHCQTPADFPRILEQASVQYIRVLENCHLRSTSMMFKDTEKNPLFCPTRFVAEDEVKTVLSNVLNNQMMTNGSRAPVILIGHGWASDESRIKAEWKLSIPKLDSIVCTVKSLAKLAAQAGIIPTPDRSIGEFNPKLDTMLQGFQINMVGMWRHNGANDAVYQATLAFLIILFPVLYPYSTSGYPDDSSINGQSINEILKNLAARKDSMAVLPVGYERFCFYCEAAESHDADDCPVKSTIVCQLCSNATGKKNARFRGKAVGHQTSRCVFQYNHTVRPFPEWLKQLNLSTEVKRKLSQGMALRDVEAVGSIFYSAILEGGPMGNDEVEELEKQEQEKRIAEKCGNDYVESVDL